MKKIKGLLSMLLVFSLLGVGCGTQSQTTTTQKPAADAKTGTQQPATGQSSTANRAPFEIKMGSGPSGAVTDALYGAVWEDFKKNVPYLKGGPTTGTVAANIMGLVQGKYNIAHSTSDLTGAALDGTEYFEKSGKVTGVYNLLTWWPMTSTMVVWADSPYQKIEDLKGKKISPGPKAGSNDLELQRILKAMGMSYSDFDVQFLGFDDAAQQMTDGHLDALLYANTAFPHAGLMSVFAQKQVRLLPIPDDIIKKVCTQYQGLVPQVLPAGTYKLKDGTANPAMNGVGSYIHWLVKGDFPEDVAYDMVKSIAENFDRYQKAFPGNLKGMTAKDLAREVPGVPLHPGSAKYFKERGFIQ